VRGKDKALLQNKIYTPEISWFMNEREEIVCRASLWYFRRMAMLMALTGGLGLLFLYDGVFGYPAKNHIADLHEIFVKAAAGVTPAPLSGEKKRSEKRTRELEEARQAAAGGASWAGFAAARMLAEEEPERYSREEIDEQFFFAGLMGVVTAGIGIFWLTRRNRACRGDDVSIMFPGGNRIRYADILEIDLQKWDRGIGRLRYREGDGEERFAKVDDYKYSGTAAILKRALAKNPGIVLEGDPRWLEIAGVPPVREQA
jgi:hypothetical protein